MLKKTLILLILCLFLITTIGYCDNWVSFYTDKYIKDYYDLSTLKIDKQNKILVVNEKREFTNKGKILWLINYESMYKKKYNNIQYIIGSHIFNVKEWQFSVNNMIGYSKLDHKLFEHQYETKWIDIVPNSSNDILLKRLIKDYNIQR
jgi:hypothetical protein